ncbi:rhodanese-like domain-containing protein [Cupriavidus pampae]|uniref:Thiosulfate sulfurtransferase GlpE n=1 Tax=Cupriavidus pampae TaxID=659251 RepID=A0ABM8XRH5_9BURK|nr:rhodanese-like domain-containing protein [Cupriavidus pampae]CAG9182908.1 Thiosulfate sulfurtransferase GlpE [Cupriavidus pampae]
MPNASIRAIDAATLKSWVHDDQELALFDVREHGQYGEGHPLFAVPLPFSRLEADIGRLAPRTAVRIALVDDGDGVADAAARVLAALGYANVFLLAGGVPAWQAAGLAVFKGVNVPSKVFGELVEHHFGTPRVTAAELAAMQRSTNAPVVLDGRPVSEFSKMNIPGAICCPNGELAYRLRDIVPDPDTPVVINCAGRTRSIIGAQSLINAGVENPIYALENGTQGWYLNDHVLEHGGTARYPDRVSPPSVRRARTGVQAFSARFEVPHIAASDAAAWLADGARTTFLLDVRTEQEHAAATLPGAQHAPGGQLVQATDQYVGVRHARLIVFDADGVRAPLVASWLRQMGHDAVVLQGGLEAGRAAHLSARPGPRATPHDARSISPAELHESLGASAAQIVDLRDSMAYRDGHIAGSKWSIRPRLARDLAEVPRHVTLIVVDDRKSGAAARLAIGDLHALGYQDVRVLAGGIGAWKEAGQPLRQGAHFLPDARCIDYLFFVHDRHDGNKDAARAYLAWETGLIAQLDERELATFKLPALDHA